MSRITLSILCLIGLAAGVVTVLSPFFVAGGLVCRFDINAAHTSRIWLNHLLGSLLSFAYGVAIMAGSGLLAVICSIALGVEAALGRNRNSDSTTECPPPSAKTIRQQVSLLRAQSSRRRKVPYRAIEPHHQPQASQCY
ncbi:hypothetical protein Poly41_54110 [Novipirellula artificiosorum]|uniref:Uncharacterized protein n=2 Tax=Novipirellula artificiosorum TaxID=2528016 RepID=A0A5C6D812_9BACT|nr:hypothetical protein Poly41_54110 [Novipirellula artificiosorum]